MSVRLTTLCNKRPKLSLPKVLIAPPAQLMQRYLYAQPSSAKFAHVEVENKFNITDLLKSKLEQENQEEPVILGHEHIPPLYLCRLPNRSIIDRYFDYQDVLSSKGIWIRKRSEQTIQDDGKASGDPIVNWEAKVRRGGNYQNSQMEEVSGDEHVKELIKPHALFETLKETVCLTTTRKSWKADEPFLIPMPPPVLVVFDRCTSSPVDVRASGKQHEFRHEVGEVEMTRAVELSGDEEADRVRKERAFAELAMQLNAWLIRHGRFFPTRPAPVGKLSAFFAWKKQADEHFAAWK